MMPAVHPCTGANGLSRPLRVLFVESLAEVSAPQTALLNMLRCLDRSSVLPFYASLDFGNGELPAQVQDLNIPVFRLPAGRFRELGATVRKINGLSRIIRQQRIDLVFSNSGHPLVFARPAALLTGRPCVWWVHAYFPDDLLRGHLISYAQMLLSSDAFLANSEFTARSLTLGFPSAGLIGVVRCGVDVAQHAPNAKRGAAAREALGIGPDEFVVSLFGRLHPFKGQDIFLQAAKQLLATGMAVRFLLVGGVLFGFEPWYAKSLHQYVEHARIGHRVLFLGHRADVCDLMNASDVVVHASIEPEPWGLVIAEAMAAGRAVIAAAAGGPLEMIDQGRTGLLVPPGDPVELARAIESLRQQPELRCRMGEAARRHAVEFFDSARAADVLVRELHHIYGALRGRNWSDA